MFDRSHNTHADTVKGKLCKSPSDFYECPLIGAQPKYASGGGVEGRFSLDPIPNQQQGISAPYASEELPHRENHATREAGAREGGVARNDAPTPSGGRALGLVYSQTSQNPIHLDPLEARLRKLKRGVITSSRLHQEAVTQGGFRGRWAMVTLTYRDLTGWNPKHISALLDHVRKWLARRGKPMQYVWVAELQKRGAMHYHVLVWLPKGLSLPKPDKQGWWPHGMTKIEWARNAVGYMAKYASKGSTKYPKGARIHGAGGLKGHQLQEARYWRRPAWLRELSVIEESYSRVSGAWRNNETGELLISPWEVLFTGGGVWIKLKDPKQPGQDGSSNRFLPGEYSTSLDTPFH